MAKLKEREPIPEFDTLEDIANFWDTHSTADYDDMTHEVHFEVALREPHAAQTIMLVPELEQVITTLAQARGVSVETLINVWLTEKVLAIGHPE
jgi:hypothetical protein